VGEADTTTAIEFTVCELLTATCSLEFFALRHFGLSLG
jgi:hypothetical protein